MSDGREIALGILAVYIVIMVGYQIYLWGYEVGKKARPEWMNLE